MLDQESTISVCFVIPYFGKLPDTMQIFLDSAACNLDYNWLLFTDDNTDYKYPSNVQVNYLSFEQLRSRIQKSFDFSISLNTPKKLCDYKPIYGFLFQNELRSFKYWGYCDLDMVLGDLKMTITNEYLEQYDKVFTLGHMSIYRNTDPVNKLFMCEYNNNDAVYTSYKQILQSEKNVAFDEWPENCVNINVLAEQEGLRVSGDWPMTDILPHRSFFRESFYYLPEHAWSDDRGPNVLLNKTGNKLYVTWINDDNSIENREIIYAHIQKRRLSLAKYSGFQSDFIIMPNRIESVDKADSETIMKYYLRGKCRRFIQLDEHRWSLQQKYSVLKHRLKIIQRKVLRYRCSQ